MWRFVPVCGVLVIHQILSAAGSPPFSFRTRTDLQSGNPTSVVSADFNADGIPDLALMGRAGIDVFLGAGSGRFHPPASIPLKDGPNSYSTVVVADVNADGKPDLIALDGVNAVTLFGNGDGTFSMGPKVSAPGGSQTAVADFNLDGKIDLALGAGNGVNILLGHGDGTFGAPLLLPVTSNLCVSTGDFNGDGKPDVAGCGLNSVVVFLGTGKGTFQPGVVSSLPSQADALAVADLNGDGHADVVGAAVNLNGSNPHLGPVYVLYGNGDGTFQPTLQVHSNIGPLFSVQIGDLDGDGRPDIAAASINGLVAALHNNGSQGFRLQAAYPITYSQGFLDTLLLADLTGSGRPDVVTTNSGGNFFSILLNNGKGRFPDVWSLEFPNTTAASIGAFGQLVPLVQADFNGDGFDDVAIPVNAASGAEQLNVYLGTGQAKQPFQPGPATPLTTGALIISLVAADFNGDGKKDVAISYGFPTAFVQIFLGNGDGTFTAGASFNAPGGLGATDMVVADFNKDGKLDLVLSSGYIALGKGDGTFAAPSQFFNAPGDPGLWLGVADFNHDGKLDLAYMLSFSFPAQLMVLLGNGDGTFQTPAVYLPNGVPQWAQLADVNGDGRPDIVVLNLGAGDPTHRIAVFLGNADGTFQNPSFVTGYRIIHAAMIVARDFNGDGKVDLAVIDEYGNNIFLFAGNGDGTFAPEQELGVGVGPAWLTSGNFHGQTAHGFPDLLMVTGPDSFFQVGTRPISISVLENQGARH